ncbi:MAG: hypothetical protein Q9222_003800 [Ikaeria aurantiellina]
MESQTNIDITVFPDGDEPEGSDGSIMAQSDHTLKYSIISKGMLNKLKLGCTACQKETIKDSRNNSFSLMGKVDLRWHKKDLGVSHAETFYVVATTTPLVILGATAFAGSSQSNPTNVHPVGLNKQTIEAEQALEEKRQEVAARRAKETAEQEQKEAERRKQAAGNK